MRPATKIFCRLLTGLFLTATLSITFAQSSDGSQSPSNAGDTTIVVDVDNQSYTSAANPSFFNTLIDTGKSQSADFSHSGQSDENGTFNANKDPFISYQLSVTNNSSQDKFYLIAFGLGIAPLGADNLFQNDLTVMTSGTGPISLSPTYDGVNSSSGLQRELMSFDGGLTFNTADEYGPLGSPITSAGTTAFPTFLLTNSSTPNYNYMELLVGFNLSPGTTAVLVGRETITPIPGPSTPIPEPSTLIMAFSAVTTLVAFNMRSRTKPRFSSKRN